MRGNRNLRRGAAIGLAWLAWLAPVTVAHAAPATETGETMETMKLKLDGRDVALTPAPQRNGDGVWVPLTAFCRAVQIGWKDVGGSLAVCDEEDGDICVLLAPADTRDEGGETFARLEAFAEPLELEWQVTEGVLVVARGAGARTGLAVGDRPPEIHLPDLETGQPVASPAYIGKPAVFYMWASW